VITGAIKDPHFYAGIVVALIALYAMQYFKAKKSSSS
jgi:hypothetical protein